MAFIHTRNRTMYVTNRELTYIDLSTDSHHSTYPSNRCIFSKTLFSQSRYLLYKIPSNFLFPSVRNLVELLLFSNHLLQSPPFLSSPRSISFLEASILGGGGWEEGKRGRGGGQALPRSGPSV